MNRPKPMVLRYHHLPTGEWVADISVDDGPIQELPGSFPTEAAILQAIDRLILRWGFVVLPVARSEDLN